jgi:hypothetical protein
VIATSPPTQQVHADVTGPLFLSFFLLNLEKYFQDKTEESFIEMLGALNSPSDKQLVSFVLKKLVCLIRAKFFQKHKVKVKEVIVQKFNSCCIDLSADEYVSY